MEEEALLQVAEQLEDLSLDGDVERGGGLVCDKQLGLTGQGHGNHDALAQAPRELVGIGVDLGGGLGDADQVEELDRARRARLSDATSSVVDSRMASMICHPAV